jgi:N4-gp56 family major capsid protein
MAENMNLHPNKGGALTKHLNSATMDSEIIYADGVHGSMGQELVLEAIDRKVMTETKKKMVFSQFGDTIGLPKGSGKAISAEMILPIMDPRNINDQGIDANGVTIENGNLIGSNNDLNAIKEFMPVLTEHGGRVNRVGITKVKITSSALCNFGFFIEHSKDAFEFSSTPQLEMHVRREMLRAAAELYELNLAQDLINGAGVVKYGGEALSMEEMTGEVGEVISQITYDGLMKLGITLDNNQTPKDTTIIKGHKNEDTLTVDASRYAIIGSELLPTFIRMKDAHGERAYHPVRHYAAAGNIAEGEAGAVDMFRIIINPFSGNLAGSGKAVANNAGYRATGGKYDIFPLVVVGSGSFSTVSLRGGKTGKKWNVYHRRPEDNRTSLDPYGKTGFFAIDWTYATMIRRPERLAVYYSVAEL